MYIATLLLHGIQDLYNISKTTIREEMLGFCRQDCSKIEEKQNNEKHKLKLKECHKESKLEICKVFNLEAMAKAAAAMTKADSPFGVASFRVVVAVGSSNAKTTGAAPGATSAGQLNVDLKSFEMRVFSLFNRVFCMVFVWFFVRVLGVIPCNRR